MNIRKISKRLARAAARPDTLLTVSRDIGLALALGQRDELREVARELARSASEVGVETAGQSDRDAQPLAQPDEPLASGPGDTGQSTGRATDHKAYWAGFSAALATLLASYESAHTEDEVRLEARRIVSSPSAQAVVLELARGPATGAELARTLELTPGAVSKVFKSLRLAGLARALSSASPDRAGRPSPERGVRKPHVLTSLGMAVADDLVGDDELAAAIHPRPDSGTQ